MTIISPGVTTSELAETISDETAREAMRIWRAIAISADAVAKSILYALSQPTDVDVSEIIIRPTSSAN